MNHGQYSVLMDIGRAMLEKPLKRIQVYYEDDVTVYSVTTEAGTVSVRPVKADNGKLTLAINYDPNDKDGNMGKEPSIGAVTIVPQNDVGEEEGDK